jgi:hypothetical protein
MFLLTSKTDVVGINQGHFAANISQNFFESHTVNRHLVRHLHTSDSASAFEKLVNPHSENSQSENDIIK